MIQDVTILGKDACAWSYNHISHKLFSSTVYFQLINTTYK